MGWLQDWSGSWHDLWEIVGAIATAAAVIVALWSSHREAVGRMRAELRADAAEGARDAERERADAALIANETAVREVQHRAQAFQVIAWLERRNTTSERFDESDRRLPVEHLIRFVNTSNAPVFDVKFHVYESERNTQGARRRARAGTIRRPRESSAPGRACPIRPASSTRGVCAGRARGVGSGGDGSACWRGRVAGRACSLRPGRAHGRVLAASGPAPGRADTRLAHRSSSRGGRSRTRPWGSGSATSGTTSTSSCVADRRPTPGSPCRSRSSPGCADGIARTCPG